MLSYYPEKILCSKKYLNLFDLLNNKKLYFEKCNSKFYDKFFTLSSLQIITALIVSDYFKFFWYRYLFETFGEVFAF